MKRASSESRGLTDKRSFFSKQTLFFFFLLSPSSSLHMFVASPPSLPFLRSTVITVFYLSLLVLVGLRGASRRCASGVSFLVADNVVSHQYSKEKGEKKEV